MTFQPTTLEGSYLIGLSPHGDPRGWFMRTYCKNTFREIGHDKDWVQLNHSYTESAGTLRGMHFQLRPYSEIKLVRCIAGSVFDVIVDLRKNSDTYMQWFGAEISAVNKKMMYIPEGFAHGFQTLMDDTELIYHHSEYYTKDSEGGIRFDDPSINIKWPLNIINVSERDKSFPLIDSNFKAF